MCNLIKPFNRDYSGFKLLNFHLLVSISFLVKRFASINGFVNIFYVLCGINGSTCKAVAVCEIHNFIIVLFLTKMAILPPLSALV